MTYKTVKLYVYQTLPEKTLVDIYQADSFNDFLIIRVQSKDPRVIGEIREMLQDEASKKKIIIIPEDFEISVYGVAEDKDDDSGLIDSQF